MTSNCGYLCHQPAEKFNLPRTFSNLMKFWLKILQMDRFRLVRICYDRLHHFHERSTNDAKYNWCTPVRHLLEDVGYTDVWENPDPIVLQEKLPEICIANRNRCIDIDVSNLLTSTSNPFYFLSWRNWRTAKYLLFHIPFSFKSLVAQLRLNARKLYFKGRLLQFGGEYCIFCDRVG